MSEQTRPHLGGIDVASTLRNFAIVTYAVEPERLRPYVHERFQLDCIETDDGPRALVSVVPFEDRDFRFVRLPQFRFSFGQTNYRAYVVDRRTSRRCVWFMGTTLGSWAVVIPRLVWRLPWHRGEVRFECRWDEAQSRYVRYRVTTRAGWAPLTLDLGDTGLPPAHLPGFADLRAAYTVLTHPLRGFYRRQDGALGTYSVWHQRMRPTVGTVRSAEVGLLDRLGLVSRGEQRQPHSVLIQRDIEFAIRLPPRRVATSRHELAG